MSSESEQNGEERPSKRQRTGPSESKDFDFDKDFHFDDGNIILVTEGRAFKVHKGVLSRHSVFFRDMFALANGSSGSESREGCQILQLSDSKQDVVYLLQALYDIRVPSSTDFTELSRLLRISNKYLAHKLFKRTVETLERAIPITYEDYKAALKIGRVYADVDIAAAAITTGTDIFLPILFYEFSKTTNPRVFDALPAHIVANILTGIHRILDFLPDVLKIVVQAKQSASDKCRGPSCRSSWKEFTSDVEHRIRRPRRLFHSMYTLLHIWSGEQYVLPGECPSCRSARISILDAEARKIWDQLPKIFNVAKNWDELREKHKKLKELDNENSQ